MTDEARARKAFDDAMDRMLDPMASLRGNALVAPRPTAALEPPSRAASLAAEMDSLHREIDADVRLRNILHEDERRVCETIRSKSDRWDRLFERWSAAKESERGAA